MKRKLIRQGLGGLTFYVPKRWSDKWGLKPGDEIDIQEEDSRLIIDTEPKKKGQVLEINIDEHSEDFINRIITNSYKKGVDELKLVFKDKPPLDHISKVLSSLTIGYEVTATGENFCIIGSFSHEEQEKIAITVRKCFFLIKDLQSVIFKGLISGKYTDESDIRSINDNIKRLLNYSIRTTVKTTKDANEIQYNSMIFSNVYLFSTKLAYIYQFAKEEKNVTENTKTLLNTLFSMFEKFSEVYYTKDLKKVNEILQMKVELTDKINNSIEKKDGKIILQATMALRCIHDSIGALIGLISG